MTSDTQLQRDIIDELKWTPSVNEAEIGVAVKDGVVTLTGNVDSWAQKYTAERVVERIIRRVPRLVDGTFRSAHSGQDGITPDQRPILGAAGPDGFFLDCGHSGTGFKTAPAVGLGMAELILDGAATSVDLAPFALDRFAAGRLLRGEHAYGPIWR